MTADVAERTGLVNRVVPHAQVGDAARAMATKLAGSSRTSLEWIKRTTYMNLDFGMEAAFASRRWRRRCSARPMTSRKGCARSRTSVPARSARGAAR
ncbi:hypothetical protein [Baekduia alba]|uniref:hypothetical protein n=1 Tax=Baekduia alba TaxID=2997333 RepID=UPI003D7A76B4